MEEEMQLSKVVDGMEISGNPGNEPIWVMVLRTHRVEIVEYLNILDILPHMQQYDIINLRLKEELLHEPATIVRTGKLLDIICTKDVEAFHHFIESLENDYSDLADKLKSAYKKASDQMSGE